MEYRIITATFEVPVYTNPNVTGAEKNLPFLNRSNISFASAEMGELRIEDDDPEFGYLSRGGSGLYYNDPGDGQTLIETTTFGQGDKQQTLDAGTRISLQETSILRDADGNEFYVFFPSYVGEGPDGKPLNAGYPIEAGGRHTVMILPRMRQTTGGEDYWPKFRPDGTYRYVGKRVMGATTSALPYDPTMQGAPCFTPGTLIETLSGPRTVETLAPGDLILTRDHGFQPLRWIGRVRLDGKRLDLCPNLRPILISQDALGPDLPQRDLIVSPQHRALLRSAIARRMFDAEEILVAATHLTALDGIRPLCPKDGVSYLHLLFDRHELVLSNGCWTESLLTGPQALRAFSSAARREIFALFPELAVGHFPPAARPVVPGRKGRQLVQRHMKNRRAFLPT
ncbi:Hint domain-containing protein [uncultured Paracoccus sp.]|uniref:Hint domain-containing protein n=1 Tax=uncultured Paracoccus sp. TaxID=189685 RepID=UPI002598E29D|nr:Hint domain-containing protein [uncultured Paracoccus sp.]